MGTSMNGRSGTLPVVGTLALGGVYLAATQRPGFKDLLETELGFLVRLLSNRFRIRLRNEPACLFWLTHVGPILAPIARLVPPLFCPFSERCSQSLIDSAVAFR